MLDMTTLRWQLRKAALAEGYDLATHAKQVSFDVIAVDINPDGSFITKTRKFVASHSSKPPRKRFLTLWYQPDTNEILRWYKDNNSSPEVMELVPDVFETRG